MSLDRSIFREYDIRGTVPDQLNEEVAWRLGYACGEYFKKAGRKKAIVGRDNRLTGQELHQALLSGLTCMEIDVIDIGIVITPAFYYALHYLDIDAGVMLTASHNPAEYNGLKVALGPGTIHGAEIQELADLAEMAPTPRHYHLHSHDGKTSVQKMDIIPKYLDMLLSKIMLGPRKLKVAVDCGNGTTSLFAVPFLERLGCEVIPLYCESDGRFPNHHPDPTIRANLTDLQRVVVENKADVGLAFDGDGDRLGVVDNEGEMLFGDMLMILFWREILAKHPGADALIEVKCSQVLVDEVKRMGGKPQFWKTGHSLMKARMREINALFAGEMSGHMYFADEFYGFDDALYAAGRLLRILSHYSPGVTLADEVRKLPKYYSTAETRVHCPDDVKFKAVADLVKHFQKTHEVITVDGVRVLFPNGWGVIRASNTQPEIVTRCEGTTPESLQEICQVIKNALLTVGKVQDFSWLY
ncbi:MAG TPA: phosphomannomutase/phosphoglucomutase [Firmicutes bacterium]|nr:phosphomannomutase/phosphoglucomutase [Bacillota bacterium]